MDETQRRNIRLKNIQLLGNVTDQKVSGFSFDLNTAMLTPDFRASLVSTLKQHKGNIPLNIFIIDENTGYRIRFFSKGYKVSVTSALINDLKALGITRCEPQMK